MLLGESEIDADERAVAAAFLGALRLLAGDGPLCLAVDDIQWLDAASLAALRYALARLDDEPVAALLAVRGDLPAWLRRAVPEGRLRTVEIGGLTVGAIQELLRARLDATFPRPTLIRLWETSGGNPFFALELASALQRRGGTLAPGEELPIPSDLDELLHARLDGLSARGARHCARGRSARRSDRVARGSPPSVAVPMPVWPRRSLPASSSWTGSACDSPIRCSGSAVAARQTPSRRRSLHARLAKIVPTAEERARHLALATAEPSGEIASILEDAARAAHARGAPATAAELAEQALRLTPPHAIRMTPAGACSRAPTCTTARATPTGRSPCSSTRARQLRRATSAQRSSHGSPASRRARRTPSPSTAKHCSEAEGDDALEATIHLRLAALMRWTEGIERGMEHGELAARAASRVGDAALRCRALAAYGLMHFNTGRGIPTAEMEEALSLERSLAEWPLEGGPTWVYGWQLWWSADVDRARDALPRGSGCRPSAERPRGRGGGAVVT